MLHPLIKWAQRKDRVFIEIQLQDITKQKIDLTPTTIIFEGESGSKQYGLTLQFFEEIDKQQSKWTKTGFHLFFVLIKKNQNQPFWPRLTKKKQKNQYIQVDWQKWVDEDEQKQQGNKGLGGIDPSQMQNFDFGNMGGFGGLQQQDDHDLKNCKDHNHHHQGQGILDDLEEDEQVQENKNTQAA